MLTTFLAFSRDFAAKITINIDAGLKTFMIGVKEIKMKATDTGIKRILKAFTYSRDGFTSAFKSEAALRQDLAVFIVFSIIALCLNLLVWQKALLICSLLFIVIMELVNTAVEVIIDRISQDYHELSKKAKDIGSLLVLLSFLNALILWAAFLYPLFF